MFGDFESFLPRELRRCAHHWLGTRGDCAEQRKMTGHVVWLQPALPGSSSIAEIAHIEVVSASMRLECGLREYKAVFVL